VGIANEGNSSAIFVHEFSGSTSVAKASYCSDTDEGRRLLGAVGFSKASLIEFLACEHRNLPMLKCIGINLMSDRRVEYNDYVAGGGSVDWGYSPYWDREIANLFFQNCQYELLPEVWNPV